jgi:quinol monooxygenase YgiN
MTSTGMPSGRAGLNLEWDVPAGKVAVLAPALHELMPSTRLQPGCLGCAVGTRAGDRVTIRYDEDWESEESLRRHVCSRSFTALAGLLELALNPPRIDFVLPGGKRGIDYAEEVRRTTGSAGGEGADRDPSL